jgi:hypothetical protein
MAPFFANASSATYSSKRVQAFDVLLVGKNSRTAADQAFVVFSVTITFHVRRHPGKLYNQPTNQPTQPDEMLCYTISITYLFMGLSPPGTDFLGHGA